MFLYILKLISAIIKYYKNNCRYNQVYCTSNKCYGPRPRGICNGNLALFVFSPPSRSRGVGI